jgi:WD40 repeat protein
LKSILKEYQLIASSSSINTIDGNKKLVALGGFEEVIRLFDVTTKKDLGSLMGSGSHEGTITSLQFFENKYLISAAEDSDILIWRCSDWNCLHRL